ncbi:Rib/alpha-like domain-containing protein [Granulicatella elegans]|uniref:Rib/alpha/Esp surface antigen n=1 Tax=Granulicatella elegans ATCC 700633 TaxID=626369 RepID=D0BNQ5_9LACT|nr:Rib/alpha-like domain-containing protein [Granulicatella elegans]EEW92398.1 rib/alpha/Esp surface antigen [Granulicatella elegans ATCC 700633]
MKDKRNFRAIQAQRFLRYSIRKFSVGVASVAIASGLAVLGGVNVQAAEEATATTPTTEAVETANKDNKQVVEKVDKSGLTSAIARLEAALEKAASTEKTTSAIESAKAELANAKTVSANEAATKEEVAKATSAVNGKAFVVESMPKATADKKEEKENKNQDSRNGQAIPGQGESGFRAVDTTAANSAEEATKYKGIRDAALTELQANIAKVQAKLDAEKAKDANKKDQAKIDTYTKIIEKANAVVTKANAADATSAQAMSQQAEAVKSERDLLAFYLAEKTELGAPVSENHVAYGNNPTNGVFESLKEGFGDKVTFTDADKKSETIAKQYESGRDITNKVNNKPDAKDPIGSATYNWQEKAITKADAEAGMLNGWKIEKGDKVNAVKPLDVTNVTDKDGQPSTREVPKSKIYSNDGELKKYQTSGENSYVNGSGAVPSVTPTIDVMRTNAFGEVKNRDYYLELGSKGTTLSKEYDVNGNSRLNVNLIHSAAYGGTTSTSAGERVKLTIVDAFTGKEIKPVEGKNGPLATEQGALAANGWNHLDRIYDIPAETTKIKVLIEAGSQGTNTLINDNNINIKDGYLIGGIGIATSPAAEVLTNVRSDGKKGEYGYTKDTIYDKGQKGNFDITIKNTGGMNIDYYSASNVEVTVEVPKGVVLEDKIYNANGGANWLGNVWANTIKWVPNDPSDNSKGGKLTYNVPAGNRMAAAETNSRTTSIPFTAADNFVGPADFKVTVKSGFGDTDAEGNRLYSYTANGLKPPYENEFNRNGLADSDNPDYKYGKVIFINSLQTNSVITVPINTNDDQLKAIAYAQAQKAIKSPEFTKLLTDVTGTAALGDTNGSTVVNKDDIAITKVAEDGRGVVKVPVTYTVDGKTYETTVDIEVNVVESKTKPIVVFEGDEITPANVKEKVEPVTIDGNKGTANEPKATDIFKTDGKAGESGLKIPTTVTHNVDGTPVTEDVTVPVTVLPRTEGEVDVPKGSTPDKVKETLKAKAEELIKTPDFPEKVPDGYTVTVGEVPEIPADIANKKGEPVVVKVPVTFTSPDGTTYTSEIPVTVNVKGSDVKPVYVVEGNQPKPADVNEAVTPDKGGDLTPVTEADINKDVPTDKVKVGATDLAVKATVKYPTGDETVNVPVKVVKGYPQLVAVSEDKKQPSPEDNIDTSDYPNDATYEYKEEVDTTAPGDKKVTVVVKQGDKVLVEVPATVRVVDSTPQFVVADPKKPQPDVKQSITPDEYPEGTTFEYKQPVDTTTAGEKEVTVVAKLDGKTIVEVPAKVMVVDPKTQYVFEKDPSKDINPEKSIDPEQYPEGTTFSYKEPVDTTTPGDKKVTVVAKDGEDKLVEVPAVVKVLPLVKPEGLTVLKGSEKLEDAVKAKAQEVVAALPKDKVPAGVTVKVKEVKAGTTPTTAEVTETGKPKPATVVIEYTDDKGNVIGTKEVEVPVTVVGSTPKSVVVFEGETPKLDKDSVTPGEGGTVGEPTTLPDTKGKAGATDVTVEVPVTYDNGKVTEKVKVPVTVLPKPTAGSVIVPKDLSEKELKDKVGKDAENAINNEEFKKKLPEGATVKVDLTNVTLPKTSTPGKAGEVEVPVIYTVNGKEYKTTVKVPVTVVEGKEQLVPKGDKPDPKDNITPGNYPEGATFEYDTPVDTSKPGKKEAVVIVKDKDGKEIVRVPVVVNVVEPKVTPIIVPERTKLTKEDVKKHIEIPGVTGWKIVGEPDLPETFPAGVRPSATVTVELPNGKTIKIQVPVIATPTTTPIVVPQGTPITEEDVKKHIDIPKESEWKIVKVGEIPTTETPGEKTAVKVKVKLPNGEEFEVEVPVTVTPKDSLIPQTEPSPATPAPQVNKVVTHFVDENGKDITSPEEGLKDPKALEGYVFDKTTTDKNGSVIHHYKKATAPTPQPVEPTTPGQAEKPATPAQPATSANAQATSQAQASVAKQELPNTGMAEMNVFTPAVLAILGGLGLAAPALTKKKDEE